MNTGEKPVINLSGDTDNGDTVLGEELRVIVSGAVPAVLHIIHKNLVRVTDTARENNGKCPGCIKTDTLYRVYAVVGDESGEHIRIVVFVCNDCGYQLSTGDAAIAYHEATSKIFIIRPV